MTHDQRWEFPMLLYRFLEDESIFEEDWEYEYKDFPWEFRVELKGFEAVLNAFTGGNYSIKSNGGRRKIHEAFLYGFGRGDNVCTEDQLNQLRELFPYRSDIFDYWKSKTPKIGPLYEVIFVSLMQGFKVITLFNDYPKGSVPFKIVETFKSKELDQHIDDMDDVFIKAILILLGPDFERSIGRDDLISKYGYPKVLDC